MHEGVLMNSLIHIKKGQYSVSSNLTELLIYKMDKIK